MTGYEELDRHGDWSDSAEYGVLWTPLAVGAGWAPYRDGRWTWIAPWGWTWIDQAPWAYAPTHYGRWIWRHNAWSWAPGRRSVRPAWAPALVSWVDRSAAGLPLVDAPGRLAIGLHLGWFPLGPRDIYRPPFFTSPGRLHRYNAGHVPRFDARRPGEWRGRRFDGPREALTALPRVDPGRRERWTQAGQTSQPVFLPTPRPGRELDRKRERRRDAQPQDGVQADGTRREARRRWERRPGAGAAAAPATPAPRDDAAGQARRAQAEIDARRRRDLDDQQERLREEQQRLETARTRSERLRQQDAGENERRLRAERRQQRDVQEGQDDAERRRRAMSDADQRLRGDIRRQQEAVQAEQREQAERYRERVQREALRPPTQMAPPQLQAVPPQPAAVLPPPVIQPLQVQQPPVPAPPAQPAAERKSGRYGAQALER